MSDARSVLLAGNGLPARWQGRPRFVVLDAAFGQGDDFLATWQSWRDDPARCERLVYIAVEQRPPTADDLRLAHAPVSAPGLAAALIDAWPPITPNLHALDFENGRVRLLLAFGDLRTWLPELVAEVDAFRLGGSATEPRIFKAPARLAATGATIAVTSTATGVREGLQSAGFEVHADHVTADSRDLTLARHAPHFVPRRAPSRVQRPATRHHALVIGAGLAGCATARALATEGWSSTVYDRCTQPAADTSGNPAGLFHGIVNAQDGHHARFNRAAALFAQKAVHAALRDHAVAGAVSGVLRLDASDVSTLQGVIDRLGLPADYVRAVDAADASALSGLPLRQAAWFYPGGGWVDPSALARAWLDAAAPLAMFRGGVEVERLERRGDQWQLISPDGQPIDEAGTVVLANASDAVRLLGQPAWPVELVRGQLSHVDRGLVSNLPHRPVAGAGYVLPDVAGQAIFGATTQPGDMDPTVRESDNLANLTQLFALLGGEPGPQAIAAVQGRVGWRVVAQDRLPIIGAAPDTSRLQGRVDQPRFVPRLPGLFVFTALASRGITWSPLGARTLASWITGAPSPLEASLLDAIDPARFVSRQARRPASAAAAHTPAGG